MIEKVQSIQSVDYLLEKVGEFQQVGGDGIALSIYCEVGWLPEDALTKVGEISGAAGMDEVIGIKWGRGEGGLGWENSP